MNTAFVQAALWTGIVAAVLVDSSSAAQYPAVGYDGAAAHHGPAAGGDDYLAFYGGHAGHWQPGGYEPRSGSPYYYTAGPQYGWQYGDPYTRHFGPGYYRHSERMHFRFPYYTYRAPWYYPGQPVYNRDTNLPW